MNDLYLIIGFTKKIFFKTTKKYIDTSFYIGKELFKYFLLIKKLNM